VHDLLLFDLDGTLVDPIQGAHQCINHALTQCGFDPIDSAQMAPFIGPPLDGTFETLVGSTAVELIDRLVATYRERYSEVGYSECRLYPGVEASLRELRARGQRLAVCTSKRVDFAERILQMLGLLELFDFVDGGEIRISKSQQIARLRQATRVTQRTVMIGDRAVDLFAAHSNGLSSAGVLWGYGSNDELAAEEPRYLFAAPSEWRQLATVAQTPVAGDEGPP
jgi:phosphoglycolate phosphatase